MTRVSGAAPSATSRVRRSVTVPGEAAPLFTISQAAAMLDMPSAFLRRLDSEGVVIPSRSPGGQRRYSRVEINHVAALIGLIAALPPELIKTVAGLALMGAFAGALGSALSDAGKVFPAVLTLAVTASGLTLYGIRNCDTVKKARAWLDARGIPYDFHDYKVAGIDAARLRSWVAEFGWEKVLNRAGTTFRKLPDADKAGLDADKAVALMLDQTSMIKRPLLDLGGRRLLGFDADAWLAAFPGA